MKKLLITAIILTYNEEENLEKCLNSISGWADEMVIVDSFSTDKTLELAGKYTDKIYQNKYEGHPQQWQWTLDNVPIKNNWIFAIDADFIVTEELWEDIGQRIGGLDEEVCGLYVRHKEVFRGRPILHGGVYPSYWLRIFRKDKVRIDENELVDVHFYVGGKADKVEYDVEERNYKDDNIFFWIQKQNTFAKRHALEEIRRKDKLLKSPEKPNFFGNPDQKKLFLKLIWYRFPLFWRPLFYFLYRYFLRGGFLDGKEGFIYHFTQGFLYRMLVDINIDEILSQKRKP